MKYLTHYSLVDDVSSHLDQAIRGVDPFIQSRYVGFFAVASAAVIELAVKDIVVEFATTHNSIFGDYVGSKYEKINGRVKLDDIKREHLGSFGDKYVARFNKRLDRHERYCVVKRGYSIKQSYASLFTCRHKFAHEGVVPEHITYVDVKNGFESGKIILSCLSSALGLRRAVQLKTDA